MKTPREIADEEEAAMIDALQRMEDAQIEIADIYAATMLYAYVTWLKVHGLRGTIETVQRYLEEEASTR